MISVNDGKKVLVRKKFKVMLIGDSSQPMKSSFFLKEPIRDWVLKVIILNRYLGHGWWFWHFFKFGLFGKFIQTENKSTSTWPKSENFGKKVFVINRLNEVALLFGLLAWSWFWDVICGQLRKFSKNFDKIFFFGNLENNFLNDFFRSL